jgi:protein gp37
MPTKIEWTQSDDGVSGETWNVVRGCSRVSPGCGGAAGVGGCYAERQAARQSGPGGAYEGLVRLGKQGPRWTGKVILVPDKLLAPMSWKKPRRIFVNSMSDMFHEELSNEAIATIFAVMAACPQHTFQILTKRATRMREWFAWLDRESLTCNAGRGMPHVGRCLVEAQRVCDQHVDYKAWAPLRETTAIMAAPWPLPNVWLGVSVETQAYADSRLPELLRCPASVRFVSYEPALGPVSFAQWLRPGCRWTGPVPPHWLGAHNPRSCSNDEHRGPALDWIIVGGESGPGARTFDVEWARSVVRECESAKVACFVKQLGRKPVTRSTAAPHFEVPMALVHRKGNDMDEWPMELRVRQWPHPGA